MDRWREAMSKFIGTRNAERPDFTNLTNAHSYEKIQMPLDPHSMKHRNGNYKILAVKWHRAFWQRARYASCPQTMKDFGAEVFVGVSARITDGGDVGREARLMGFETFNMAFGATSPEWILNDAVTAEGR